MALASAELEYRVELLNKCALLSLYIQPTESTSITAAR
jgi:hypothetical protein